MKYDTLIEEIKKEIGYGGAMSTQITKQAAYRAQETAERFSIEYEEALELLIKIGSQEIDWFAVEKN